MLAWVKKIPLLTGAARVVIAAAHASGWAGHAGIPFRKVPQSAGDARLRVCAVHAVRLAGFAVTRSDVVADRTLQANILIVLVLAGGAGASAEVAAIVGEVDSEARAALAAGCVGAGDAEVGAGRALDLVEVVSQQALGAVSVAIDCEAIRWSGLA